MKYQLLSLALASATMASPHTLQLARNDEGDSIVGGTATTIEQHPHQVTLQVNGQHNCGGSIIGPRHVLTAGHCIGSTFTVGVGNTNVSQTKKYKVKRSVVHPKFNRNTLDYDVAYVEMAEDFAFSNSVKAIAIHDTELTAGSSITVTGWGRTRAGGPGSEKLLAVDLKVVDRATCRKAHSSNLAVTDRMVCAGGDGGKGACNGDSGGPLTIGGKLAGTVSWGKPCANSGFPDAFGNLANAEIRDFIKKGTGI